jgi:hypothetical protein
VTFRLTPDKLLDNAGTEQLTKALWETYSTLAQRVTLERGIHYRRPDAVSWEIELSDLVRYRLAVPRQWAGYAREHIGVCWPRTAITEDDTAWPDGDVSMAYLRQRRHYYLSLQIDSQGLAPADGICLTAQDIRPDERALVQVLAIPEADSWAIGAAEAFEKGKAGEFVPPQHADARTYKREAAYQMACGMQGGLDFMVEVLTGEERQIKIARNVTLPGQQIPTRWTRDKLGKSAFKATVRIVVESPDPRRREALVRSLAVAFRALGGDNELERVDVPPKRKSSFLGQMRSRVLPMDCMTLSTAEVGCLMRLPPAVIQSVRVDSLAFREGKVPAVMTQDGIDLGRVTQKGVESQVFWPTTNNDELCLSRVIIGGMGSGKTTDGAIFALSAAKLGYSVFAFDVADGRLCDLIRDGVDDPSRLKIIDLGQTNWPIGLDWHESAKGVDAMNRLSAECASYFSRWVDETGGRTRRWLRAAAKAVYGRPDTDLLDVVLMLLSEGYREKVVPKLTDPLQQEIWRQFGELSDAQRREWVNPILSRLDYLLEDNALRNILCQPSKSEIDWRRWADDGSVVLVRVPKNKLGDTATDALMSFLIRKLWLSILTRQDQPLSARRPCFCIMDEPHQYMSSASLWEQMVVEARQWRLGLVWMFHSFAGQFPVNLRRIIESAGPHYLLLNSGKETYEELEEEIAPYTVEEALRTPAHWGIARVKAGGKVLDPFLMRLPPEPKRLADRSRLNEEHARRFGRPVSEVEASIVQREMVVYQAMMGGAKGADRAKPRNR